MYFLELYFENSKNGNLKDRILSLKVLFCLLDVILIKLYLNSSINSRSH